MLSHISNISNVVQDIPLTIAPSDWSSYLGSYVYNWTDIRVASGSSLDVEVLESTGDDISYVGFEKTSNGIQFTVDHEPTDNIQLVVRIVNAKADVGNQINADIVATDAISGAANVDEALTIIDNRIDSLDPESATGVFTDVTFGILANQWTLSGSVYTYTYSNVLITATAGIEVFYDSTFRSAMAGDVHITKNTGNIVFTTTEAPIGTLSGTIRIIESVSGVIPTHRGGTGSVTIKGARQNLNVSIKPIPINFGTVSSLPQTIYDNDITSDMIPVNVVYGTPSACPNGLTCTTAAGSVTISLPSGGSFSGETTVNFDLVNPRTVADGGSGQEQEQMAADYVQIGAQTLTESQKTQVQTNIGAASASDVTDLSETVASNTDAIANMKLVHFTALNLTIPDGRTTLQTVDIDFSSVVPSGKTLVGNTVVKLGNYNLPYRSTDGVLNTWVDSVSNVTKKIRIHSNATEWTNYTLSVILFFK